jgi:hypothetical protein
MNGYFCIFTVIISLFLKNETYTLVLNLAVKNSAKFPELYLFLESVTRVTQTLQLFYIL